MSSGAWVLATRNRGKIRELEALLRDEGIDVVSLDDVDVPESAAEDELEVFETFEENALAKAQYFASRVGGRPVVADDSGLEVFALGGAPGVRSKRWSGRDDLRGAALDAANNALLRTRLRGVTDRRARFVCAAAWCFGEEHVVACGEVPGRIDDEPRGEHGFGYDPHFFATELGVTLAQATVPEKQRVSHRGRAFTALLAVLRARGALRS